MKCMTAAANASFISNKSMSLASRPARAKAFRAAGAGPVSMMVGSAPLTPTATTRPRGA